MKARPLYRSLTFWSGILAIGFICWAWKDSFTRYASFTAMRASAGQAAGGVGLSWHPDTSPVRFLQSPEALTIYAPEGRLRGSSPRTDNASVPLCPPFLLHEEQGLFIPHWFILLAVALLWSLLLFLRARRFATAMGAD